MLRRRLPGTDVDLSVFAFGPMRLGRGTASLKEGERALHAAYDAGLTTVHSSSEYPTASALRDALARHPRSQDLEHVIKVQTPEYGETAFDAATFEDQIDQALRDLGAERIDVVQHLQRGPADAANAYDERGDALRLPAFEQVHLPLVEAAMRLKAVGKIGALVCFPHTMPYAKRALDAAGLDGFAHFFGPLEVEFATEFPRLVAQEQGFIAIRPLLQGMLTDARATRSLLPAGDHRHEARFDAWYSAIDALRGALGGDPEHWARFSLRFSITPQVVTTSVVGINSMEQLKNVVVAASAGPLDDTTYGTALAAVSTRPAPPKSTLF